MKTLLLVSHGGGWVARRVGKPSQEHPMPTHPESVGSSGFFFFSSLKAASVFSIGEGMPSYLHSSFLTGAAVFL